MPAFLFVKFVLINAELKIRLIRVIGLRRAEGSWLIIIPNYLLTINKLEFGTGTQCLETLNLYEIQSFFDDRKTLLSTPLALRRGVGGEAWFGGEAFLLHSSFFILRLCRSTDV